MPEVTLDAVVNQILAILREGFEGPPEKWSYFVDGGPDAGYLGTLGKLTSVEVSRPIGGSTIAAHVHHMIFSLEAGSAWIRGDHSPRNWSESWKIATVDDREWPELCARIQAGYMDLRKAIESHGRTDEDSIGGAIGALAHAAYHLGAIRQKVIIARQM